MTDMPVIACLQCAQDAGSRSGGASRQSAQHAATHREGASAQADYEMASIVAAIVLMHIPLLPVAVPQTRWQASRRMVSFFAEWGCGQAPENPDGGVPAGIVPRRSGVHRSGRLAAGEESTD